MDLQTQVDDFPALARPTPGAHDHKGTAKEGQRRGQLDEAAEQKWQTPSSSEWGGTPEQHLERKKAAIAKGEKMGLVVTGLHNQIQSFPYSHQAPATSTPGPESSPQTRRLNPRFVCFLMGWPMIVGTGSAPWAMEWCRFKSRMRSQLSRLLSGSK